jgi:hypothetical protein
MLPQSHPTPRPRGAESARVAAGHLAGIDEALARLTEPGVIGAHPSDEAPARPGPARDEHDAEPVSEEVREGLFAVLAGPDPKLGRSSVGWRTKDLQDGRRIWVGRCTFEHESGESDEADLAAGHG